jgi:hypothetical protein
MNRSSLRFVGAAAATYPYYLNLRAFNQSGMFFKTKTGSKAVTGDHREGPGRRSGQRTRVGIADNQNPKQKG